MYRDENERRAIAHKLTVMAARIEADTIGPLTLSALGDVFGNEFWLLVVGYITCQHDHRRDALLRAVTAVTSGQLARPGGEFDIADIMAKAFQLIGEVERHT